MIWGYGELFEVLLEVDNSETNMIQCSPVMCQWHCEIH